MTEEVKLPKEVVCYTTNTTIDAGINCILCEADTALLQGSHSLQGKGRWKLMSGKGKLQQAENSSTLVKDLVYRKNTFEWSIPANTCGTDSLKATVIITRVAKPAAPVISQIGADSLSCSITAKNYEWLLDGKPLKENSQTILVSQKGSYTVRVMNENDCSSELSATFSYVPTGIEPQLAALVKLYPNPSNGHFILILPAQLGKKAEITVIDAFGRNVYQMQLTNHSSDITTEEIDLSTATPGVYFLKLHTPKGIIVKKFFKN